MRPRVSSDSSLGLSGEGTTVGTALHCLGWSPWLERVGLVPGLTLGEKEQAPRAS